MREYIEDIELSIPVLNGIQGGIIELVTKTVTESLRRKIPSRAADKTSHAMEHIEKPH